MTRYLLPACLILAIAPAHAQDAAGGQQVSSLMPESNKIITRQISAYKTAKTTAGSSRLIAHTEMYEGYGIDSMVYIYGGSRGSGKILAAHLPTIAFSNRGDAFVNADSMDRYHAPESVPPVPLTHRYRDYCTYDASNRILTHTQHTSTTTTFRLYYTYDAAGNVIRRLTRSTPVGQNNYTDLRDEHFRYDANNHEILDSMFMPGIGPDWRRFSYYDAWGRLSSSARYGFNTASGTWTKTDTVRYTYYPNNLLKTSERHNLTGSMGGYRDSIGYTGNNPLYTYGVNFVSTAGGPWTPDERYVNTLTPDGENYQLMMISGYNGTAYVPTMKIVGYFNADSTARRGEYYRYTSGVPRPTPHMALNYYYEKTGTPPTAAVAGLNQESGLRVYPNPAGAFIMIDLPQWQGEYLLEVLDAAGRIAASMVCDKDATRLEVSRLTAGWYSVRIRSADGKQSAAGRFVKW